MEIIRRGKIWIAEGASTSRFFPCFQCLQKQKHFGRWVFVLFCINKTIKNPSF